MRKEHLDSISTALDLAQTEGDLAQIKEELIQAGYVKRHTGEKNTKKQKLTSQPLHYISSDGYDIYVGKNNLQNEELTFKFANGGDWWFHAKGIPGSHVVIKTGGDERLTAHLRKLPASLHTIPKTVPAKKWKLTIFSANMSKSQIRENRASSFTIQIIQ